MLGVANEALFVELAAALSATLLRVAPNAKQHAPQWNARQTLVWIKESVEKERESLRGALRTADQDVSWLETLRDLIDGTSQVIRLTRNDFGHPNGLVARQDDVLQLLTLFPRFAQVCHSAGQALHQI
jgi:hypothetical protein